MSMRNAALLIAAGAAAGAVALAAAGEGLRFVTAQHCTPAGQLLDFRTGAASRFAAAIEAGAAEDAASAGQALVGLSACTRDGIGAVRISPSEADRLALELADRAARAQRRDIAAGLAPWREPVATPASGPGGVFAHARSADQTLHAAILAARGEVEAERSLTDAAQSLSAAYAALEASGHDGPTRARLEAEIAAIGLSLAGRAEKAEPALLADGAEAFAGWLEMARRHGAPADAAQIAEAFHAALETPTGEPPPGWADLRERAAHQLVLSRAALLDGSTERRPAFEAAVAEAEAARTHMTDWRRYADASLAIFRHHLALGEEDAADAALVEAAAVAMDRRVNPGEAHELVRTLIARRAFTRGAPRAAVAEDLPYDLCAVMDAVGSRDCFQFASGYVDLAAQHLAPSVEAEDAGASAGPAARRASDHGAETALLFGSSRVYDPAIAVPSRRFGPSADPSGRTWFGRVRVQSAEDGRPVVVRAPEVFDHDARRRFHEALAAHAGAEAILLYIPGASADFGDAAREAAAIAEQTGFQGAAAVYSAPARLQRLVPSILPNPAYDRASAESLAGFIRALSRHGAQVHVVAADEGAELLAGAARRLDGRGVALGEVAILDAGRRHASPARAASLITAPAAGRVTLYSPRAPSRERISVVRTGDLYADAHALGRAIEDIARVLAEPGRLEMERRLEPDPGAAEIADAGPVWRFDPDCGI